MSDAQMFDVVSTLEGHAEEVAYIGKRKCEGAGDDGRLGGVPLLGGEVNEEEVRCQEDGKDGEGDRRWEVCFYIRHLEMLFMAEYPGQDGEM